MRISACASLKLISAVAWLATVGSFLLYNFFVRSKGLGQPPCGTDAVSIVWRSTRFCATPGDARLWQLNYEFLRLAPICAAVLTALAVACQHQVASRRSGEQRNR